MGKNKRSKKSDEALTRLSGVGGGIFVIDKRLTVRKKQKGKEKHVSSRLCIHNTQTMVPPLCTQTAQSAVNCAPAVRGANRPNTDPFSHFRKNNFFYSGI
jgi:hypothetical protein